LGVSARRLGFSVAVLALIADQANKLWLIFVFGIAEHQPVRLAPFFDVVYARNPGISYSLLSTNTPFGRWALFAGTIVATFLIAIWLWRASTRLVALGLGLIVGGALGNACDRLFYGTVADFYYFHVGGFSWYIFNLADCAIVAGVGLLLYDGLVSGRQNASSEAGADTPPIGHTATKSPRSEP
jgi:signal peptidase II